MKINLTGINVVRKRLANGEVRIYYYDRATGKRVKGQPGTAAFSISRDSAARGNAKEPNTFLAIARLYFASAEFTKLAPNTRDKYRIIYNRHISAKWDSTPVEAFSDRRIRGDAIEWRDQIAKLTPSMATDALMVLRIIVNCAIDRGQLERNHLDKISTIYTVDRSECLWSHEQIALILSVATPEMQWLVQMALLTLQRIGDLMALEWNAIQNGRLILRAQEKTFAAVSLAIEGPLAALLDSIPRRAPTILTTVRGQPWTVGAYRKAWKKTLAKAGLEDVDLHFHDMRGTGATAIADAGRPFHEIAAMTGHSLQGLNRILPRYVKLNSTHANNAQAALAETWIGKLQTKLQTEGKKH